MGTASGGRATSMPLETCGGGERKSQRSTRRDRAHSRRGRRVRATRSNEMKSSTENNASSSFSPLTALICSAGVVGPRATPA
eukprot:scaffold174557_cov32-Tisochrysis_lutea.AAC.2